VQIIFKCFDRCYIVMKSTLGKFVSAWLLTVCV